MASRQQTPSVERAGTAEVPRGPVMPRPTVPRRRRRTGVLLAGILLCLLGGLGGGWVAANVGDTEAVLAVARSVGYGEAVQDGDLRVVQVSVDPGLSVVPASGRGRVVGRFATTDLTPGALVTPGSVTAERVPGPGEELVGVAVSTSRMPTRPMHAGDQVVVVSTPPEDAEPSQEQPERLDATVVSVGRVDDNGMRVVDLRVAAGAGPMLAARAATGRIALVLESPGG